MKSPKWGLQMIAKLVKITPVLSLILNPTTLHRVYKPTSITGGPPVVFVGL